MKKILITGANSYIGTSFEDYMKDYSEYQIDTLDMKDPNWNKYDFSGYDIVFHVAGIAHQKETKENASLYYKINRDLAIEVATKAKQSNVKQFIFMSSMSVYGLEYSNELITLNTPLKPKTNYGKSKMEAEEQIMKLADKDFIISIVRPPMVYGDGCPGNLTKLFNAVRKIHIFPTIRNERSSITVERLSEKINDIIEENKSEIYLPQNDEYMCTYEIVKEQMIKEKVKVLFIPIFNPIIKIMIGKVRLITKVFGDLKYEK
ncbi:NAD-dependent epimerase/dehydratase family protein [Thomasclavelia sp.]|uniref:NAD-dependent epimerase/dehydratase family protein n=1 Tax=Thomasclavelia sp. TaxID=3025757 RepID=UPI0025D1B07B|nr:NAD-dependent epimerase/dehydratase family protein [Thomasclavelia sp.]